MGCVLLSNEIQRLIEHVRLIEDADPSLIQPASYDARLGEEVYKEGKVFHLSDTDPLMIIEPNSMIMASSTEIFHLPDNVIGRYYLRQRLTWKGVVLLGAGQLDPGYEGRIFGLIYNFSAHPVELYYNDHLFTIEFVYTTDPSEHYVSYEGPYQGALSLQKILPAGITVESGGRILERSIKEIKDLTDLQRQIYEKSQERFFLYLGIVIGLFALLEVVVGIISLVK